MILRASLLYSHDKFYRQEGHILGEIGFEQSSHISAKHFEQ